MNFRLVEYTTIRVIKVDKNRLRLNRINHYKTLGLQHILTYEILEENRKHCTFLNSI